MIESGIVIDDPWISRILDGRKNWEMRSSLTCVRGPIALIKKGTGTIVGVATLTDCCGPINKTKLLQYVNNHTITEEQLATGAFDKWKYAWVLSDVKPLPNPIAYHHAKGAVIWVRLDSEAKRELQQISSFNKELGIERDKKPSSQSTKSITAERPSSTEEAPSSTSQQGENLPVAKDGTHFGRHLGIRGFYQIGEKGSETRYKSFDEALQALSKMKTARWRRPNAKGNWGIVAAVEWRAVE
jgi:hypothetical protein